MARDREGAANHDVMAYWNHLAAQNVGDLECRTLIAALAPFVESLGRIDADGQELRYFENRDGRQSLADHAVVNLRLLQASVVHLREVLAKLVRRISDLEYEVAAGAMTNECSRSDLIQIARIVGPHDNWSEPEFADRKATAMVQFGLTNSSVSRALKAIRDSRELRSLIGFETALKYLTADALTDVVVRWLETNPPATADAAPNVIEASAINLDEIFRHGREAAALDRWVAARLSVEEFADLQTVFYIGRDKTFGDLYDRLVDQTLKAHRMRGDRLMVVHHIMSKTNLIAALVAGLARAGQPALAERIRQLRDDARPRA
jgi:hypothetical protein